METIEIIFKDNTKKIIKNAKIIEFFNSTVVYEQYTQNDFTINTVSNVEAMVVLPKLENLNEVL